MRHIELLQKLIKFKSVTPLDDGCIEFLKELLQSLNFECHIVEFHEEGFESVKNLYARLGKNGKNFCFAGHIDVVPSGKESAWIADPFSGININEIIYGRGAVDMKGAIAAFIEAIQRNIENGIISDGNSISLLITADEEGIAINGIKKMIPWLKNKNEKIDVCVIGEPTSNIHVGDVIKIGARGSINITIEVLGKQGHVAYHHLAENPINKLADIIKELELIKFDEGNIYFEPSNLEFTNLFVENEAVNMIPRSAIARCNIRFGNMHTAEGLSKTIEDICRKYTENFNLEWHSSGEAFITDYEGLAPIVSEAIKEVTGIDAQINTLGGTSDARFLTEYCSTVELGLLNSTAHQINESVSLRDMEILINIYVKILSKYFIDSA